VLPEKRYKDEGHHKNVESRARGQTWHHPRFRRRLRRGAAGRKLGGGTVKKKGHAG
jgi:hypothetical protein